MLFAAEKNNPLADVTTLKQQSTTEKVQKYLDNLEVVPGTSSSHTMADQLMSDTGSSASVSTGSIVHSRHTYSLRSSSVGRSCDHDEGMAPTFKIPSGRAAKGKYTKPNQPCRNCGLLFVNLANHIKCKGTKEKDKKQHYPTASSRQPSSQFIAAMWTAVTPLQVLQSTIRSKEVEEAVEWERNRKLGRNAVQIKLLLEQNPHVQLLMLNQMLTRVLQRALVVLLK
jgi:hypothetical protein